MSLCRKEPASHEYHAAIKELENKVQQNYVKQNKVLTKEHKQIETLKEQHESKSSKLEQDMNSHNNKSLFDRIN